MVKRNRLPRAHDKHGKTLVAIDLDDLQHKPLPVWPPRRQPVNSVVATLKTRIEQLEAELAAEQQRSAGYRAHYEHERERADLLARSQCYNAWVLTRRTQAYGQYWLMSG